MVAIFFKWQTLLGAFLGAFTPFVVVIFSNQLRKSKERKDALYFLHRVLVNHINHLVDIERTLVDFLDTRFQQTLQFIEGYAPSQYSMSPIFFPSFSVRTIPEEVRKSKTGSIYLDNHIEKVYSLSQDLPYIVSQLNADLQHVLELSNKIAWSQRNDPITQKRDLLKSLREYEQMVRRDFLFLNLEIMLKWLVHTLVIVQKLEQVGSLLHWQQIFEPRWTFFRRRSDYQKAKSENVTRVLDPYFEQKAINFYSQSLGGRTYFKEVILANWKSRTQNPTK